MANDCEKCHGAGFTIEYRNIQSHDNDCVTFAVVKVLCPNCNWIAEIDRGKEFIEVLFGREK